MTGSAPALRVAPSGASAELPAELDFWHPVLRSEELEERPARVRVAGVDLAVFRSEPRPRHGGGRVAAVLDRCPHRGASLSGGAVKDGCVVCPYHGWSWAADGRGRSPGNPEGSFRTVAFDALESDGAVWIKRAGTAVPFPRVDAAGFLEIARMRVRVRAPLELVLDNFIEVEHTGKVHYVLGYDTERMDEVICRTEVSAQAVRVYNQGPQKPMPWILRRLFRYPPNAHFVDDWTTTFAPVRSVYDQYWIDHTTGERAGDYLRNTVFFTPIEASLTELFVFLHAEATAWGRLGLNSLALKPITAWLGKLEVGADVKMIEGLADKSTEIRGNQLGRFDKGPLAARNRVRSIYRRGVAGLDAAREPVEE
ncbi:MAG: Rieske 2Fe-2S domain-containing protein [Myxococcales bacterium]|nr:Rieske 2Fe-2S domain-containing protein [Myxococcales bacterium]